MMSKVWFRFADEEDAPEVFELMEKGKKDGSSSCFGGISSSINRIEASIASDMIDGRWYLGEVDDLIVSAVYLRRNQNETTEQTRGTGGEIVAVAMDSRWVKQQKEFPKSIIRAVEAVFASMDCSHVLFKVNHAADVVMSWFRELGYHEYGGGVTIDENTQEMMRHTILTKQITLKGSIVTSNTAADALAELFGTSHAANSTIDHSLIHAKDDVNEGLHAVMKRLSVMEDALLDPPIVETSHNSNDELENLVGLLYSQLRNDRERNNLLNIGSATASAEAQSFED